MSLSNCYANATGCIKISDNFIHVDDDVTLGELAVVYNGLTVQSNSKAQPPAWGSKYRLTTIKAPDVNVLFKDDYVLIPTDAPVIESKMMIGKVVSDDTNLDTRVEIDVGDNTYTRYLNRQLLFRIDNLRNPNKFYRPVADRYNIEAVVGDIVRVYSETCLREVLEVYPLSGMVRLSKSLDAEGKEVTGYLNEVYFRRPRAVVAGEYAIAASDYPLMVPDSAATLSELSSVNGIQACISVFDIREIYGDYCLAKNLDTNSIRLYLKEALRPLTEREVVKISGNTK